MSTSSTFNNASPIFNVDTSLSNLVDDFNLNSKQDDPLCLSTYYYFPSPLSNYNELDGFNDFVEHYNHHDQVEGSIEQVIRATSSSGITDDSSIFINKMGSSKVEEGNTNSLNIPNATSNVPNKRRTRSSNKKDRHSKIKTAQGLRDRRMRLSIEVAHPFFKLQDMLGYDTASRTVKWLLVQSKHAIEELVRSKVQGCPSGVITNSTTMSSISDCEVESMTIIDDENKSKNCQKTTKNSLLSKSKVKRKPNRATKESRIKARARARERTRERMIMTSSSSRQVNDNEDHVLSSRLGQDYSNSQFGYNNNGIYDHPSIEIPDQVNRPLGENWNSLFTTFSYQPRW